MHTMHGNRVKTFGIKLLHVNKGNSHFRNKINDIQIMLDQLNPDIISNSEANVFQSD